MRIQRRLSLVATGVITCVLCVPAVAATHTQQKPLSEAQELANSGFRLKPGPPPGFSQAEVDKQQTTLVSVYFGSHFIGNEVATFDRHKIQFTNPKKLVSAIDGVKQAKKIRLALTGFIPTHKGYLCQYHTTIGSNVSPYCKTLSPKIAGVIFDESRFRVDLFINPKYLNLINAYKFHLPPSSASFSALDQNTLLISGDQDTQTYTVLNQGEFGYQNNHITSYLTYTETHIKHGPSPIPSPL